MRSKLKFILLLAAAMTLGCSGDSNKFPVEISFYHEFETAKAEAGRTKKPLIIDFYTDWCKYCKMLDTLTYVDSIVISMSNDYLFVKIDAERDTILARDYGIAGYPTIVVTNSDGSEIDRIWGYLPPNEFYNQVQLYLQGKETLDDYLSRLEDEPDNPEYLMLIGEKFASRSQWQKSIDFYNRVLQLDLDNKRGLGSRSLAAVYDVHSRSRDYKTAIEIATDLINRFPDSPEAETATAMLGYFAAKSGDDKNALILYRQYLEKYPNAKEDWVNKRIADIEGKL